jgi:hypothetical protein
MQISSAIVMGLTGLSIAAPVQAAGIERCGSGIIIGDVRVTPESIAAFEGIRCIFGTLDLGGSGDLQWSSLWRVYGHLHVDGSQLTTVALPNLDEVWHDVSVRGNGVLQELEVPALGSINAAAVIRDNPELRDLSFHALGAINGRLEIAHNASLREVSFEALGALHGVIAVTDNASLPTCDVERELSPISSEAADRVTIISGNGPC